MKTTVLFALLGLISAVNSAEAADSKAPFFFKVYSADGGESLTATCGPNREGDDSEIFCMISNVRIRTPEKESPKVCGLMVAQFGLAFKRVDDDQWISKQDKPGALSKVLKIYELTRSKGLWDLTETRVATKGADEKTNRTSWTSTEADYKLPCERIRHDYVQAPTL